MDLDFLLNFCSGWKGVSSLCVDICVLSFKLRVVNRIEEGRL